MMGYASVKFNILVDRKNPTLAQIDKPGALDDSEVFNFRQAGLQLAFNVENMYTRETKNDPRYVKIITRLSGRKNG